MASIDITAATFDQTITGNDIVILDFWAEWCGPCRSFAPVFESASEANSDIVFGKIDTEVEQELAAGFNITSIPTLMVFRENVIVFSQPGALNGAQLDELVAAVRGLNMDEVHASIAAQAATS